MVHAAGLRAVFLGLFAILFVLFAAPSTGAQPVERYGVFEATVPHDADRYDNAFTDVVLEATFTAPSGRTVDFHGFYDGDGRGGNSGDVWKLRFMPEETGTYTYTWRFSDGSKSGSGSFEVSASQRRPPLRVCQSDPRWLCYGGEGEPVLLKSYKPDTQHTMDAGWIAANVYQPLAAAGYNHLMIQQIPSSFKLTNAWADYSGAVLSDRAVTNKTAPLEGSVNLEVWQRWDEHLAAMNDLGLQAWAWTGIGGDSDEAVDYDFDAMSSDDREAWVRYWTARWAPFANMAWGYHYEKDAPSEFFELLDRYDPWDHLKSSQWHPLGEGKPGHMVFDGGQAAADWYPISHASNWRYSDDDNPQALHERILGDRSRQEAITGEVMPYYNSEGATWTQQFDISTSPEEFTGVIWATITAGAYFNWNWAATANTAEPSASGDLLSGGYDEVAQVAYRVLEEQVGRWYNLESRDDLLASDGKGGVWAMAEPGRQYLVFARGGKGFELSVAPGADDGAAYIATWIDARTGAAESAPDVRGDGSARAFDPPSRGTDWVLVLQQPGGAQPVELGRFEAMRQEEGVELSWTTLSESGNAGFEVERRVVERKGDDAGEGTAASSWTRLGFVEGAGTTTEPQTYRFTDRLDESFAGDEGPAGVERLVYRLKQVDRDGGHTYSPEVEVRVEAQEQAGGELALHSNAPNPFRGQTTIRYAVPRPGRVQVAVYDVLGRRVRRLVDGRREAGEHAVTLEGQGLATGVYVVVLEAAGARLTRKITRVR